MKSKKDLSIYFIIGYSPCEYFDASRIGSYFPLPISLLINSISKLFFDLPSDNYQVLTIGQKEDFQLLQHTNNKAYYQFGDNDFFYISGNQDINIKYYDNLFSLFNELAKKISRCKSKNILLILQDHGSALQFNTYSYLLFLYKLSRNTKNFFIYNDCCYSGSLIDFLKKNNIIFNELKKNGEMDQEIEDFPYIFRLYSEIQSLLFDYFHNYLNYFFPKFINFLSKIDTTNNGFLFSEYFINIIQAILNACTNQGEESIKYFETPINKNFFDKLKRDSNFDISQCIKSNSKNTFKDFESFRKFLKSIKSKNLSNLMMIKVYQDFFALKEQKYIINYFKKIYYYKLFIGAEEKAFELPKLDDDNTSLQTIAQHKKIYDQVTNFFNQYIDLGIPFFEFKSKIEIVTSTSHDKTSLSYPSISVNSITKVFPNTPSFASFIRIAFFKYNKHEFKFDDFECDAYYDNKERKYIYFASYGYKKYEKQSGNIILHHYQPNHFIYPELRPFYFNPSPLLPKRIAAVRFLTYFVRSYLSQFTIKEYIPKLSFSCGFSRIPSELLINFITLSILPKYDYLPSDLQLKNKNFLSVLKLSYLIFSQTHSDDTSTSKQPKQICINNGIFEFITFFSTTLSSKIRYILAQNLLKILSNKPNIHSSIYIFSIKELEYTQEFIKSNQLDKRGKITSDSESTKLFLTKLFSIDFIKQFYNITPENNKKSEGLKKLHELIKKCEFNLQKMFLDLESSILNILPIDISPFLAIYSYLLLKNHSKLNKNYSVKDEVQLILENLSQLFDKNICIKIETKLKAFDYSIKDIIQFCDQYIFARLQKTYDFLQSFYESYYYINFCKVSNRYKCINTKHKYFLDEMNKTTSIKDLTNSITEKLKPFPLFCFPFIFYNHYSLTTYIESLEKVFPNVGKFPNSSSLLTSNDFYSQQFRIRLSNLSLYSELKRSVVEDVDILNRFVNNNNKDIEYYLSTFYFQISKQSPEIKEGKDDDNDEEEEKEEEEEEEEKEEECDDNNDEKDEKKDDGLKNAIEFCVGYNFEDPLKESISIFIEQFKSNLNDFLNFDLDNTTKLVSINDIDDFQFFFIRGEEDNIYIDSILNNLMNLINILSISSETIVYDKEEEIHEDTVHLTFLVLGARFNNEVEINPIVKLIPEYIDIISDKDYSIQPTNKEFMALCSALSFTLNPIDKFRDRVFKKSSLLKIEEEKAVDESYSPPDSGSNSPIKIGDFRNKFYDTNDNSPPIIPNSIYKQAIQEAFLLSDIEILKIQENYEMRYKRWTEIIWNIFFDFFNKKLKEINLNFDLNDKYLQVSSYFNCFAKENKIIMEYLPQLENLSDLHEKDYWIGRFVNLHKEFEPQIRSAYVYALLSSYIFLNSFYTFDDF